MTSGHRCLQQRADVRSGARVPAGVPARVAEYWGPHPLEAAPVARRDVHSAEAGADCWVDRAGPRGGGVASCVRESVRAPLVRWRFLHAPPAVVGNDARRFALELRCGHSVVPGAVAVNCAAWLRWDCWVSFRWPLDRQS